MRDRLDSPTTQDCASSLSGAPQSASSAGASAYYQQRLTLAQQRQKELLKRIAHAQESQIARTSADLLEVWHREIFRWKNVEQAAAQALRDIG